MTAQELLREALKDPILRDKYHIPEEEIKNVSFDATSQYPIIETLKTIIQLKINGTADINTYKTVKMCFNIKD